jgi:hypothetical protein
LLSASAIILFIEILSGVLPDVFARVDQAGTVGGKLEGGLKACGISG